MPQTFYKEGAITYDAPTTSTPHVKYSASLTPKPKPLSVPVRKALPPPKPPAKLKPVPVRKARPDESPSMRRWRWSWQ